jgi:hypothetical protein
VNAPEPRPGVGEQLRDQVALTTKAVLFLVIVVTLRLVGASICTTVVIAVLVAIFGPGLLPWESIMITRRATASPDEVRATAAGGGPATQILRKAADDSDPADALRETG